MNNHRPRNIYGLFLMILLASFAVMPAFAQDETLILDPASGNYRLRYLGEDNEIVDMLWVPPTKVKPSLKSRVLTQSHGTTRYLYSVAVETRSPQPLASFNFDASQAIGTREEPSVVNFPGGIPPGWKGDITPSFRSKGVFVGWIFAQLSHQGTTGLQPGQKQGGFYVDSRDLPGVGNVRLRGSTPLQGFPGEGPGESEVGLKLREVQMGFVPRLAAIPRISVPTPFDAAVVLGNIRKHVKDDMVPMQLIDPALFSLIDRSLDQAIAAAQGGNTSSLLHEIKNIRRLLKQEHADVDKDDDDKEKKIKSPIDKLAARVLDFDLKYIEKQVKREKD